jgi:MFS family permease
MELQKGTGIRVAALMGLYFSYFMSYFIKLSPSIIMPVLQQQYNFTSAQTGFIASMYFLPYATMQFFVGPLCRKLGTGPFVGSGLLISCAGLLVFSNGSTVAALALGRFLLGLGTSPIFIGLVYYMRGSFEPSHYARYYGLGIFISNLGSIFAAAPLKAILKVLPIDDFFLILSIVTACLGLFMIIIDRHSSKKAAAQAEGQHILAGLAKDLKSVVTVPILLAGLLMWLIQAPSLVSYQGLWCTKWTGTAFPSFEHLSGLSGIAISIGSMIASLLGEKLVSSFKKRTGRPLGTMLTRICLLHIGATMLLSISKLQDSALLFVLSMLCDVLFGFPTGCIIVQVGVLVKENTTEEHNASIMGVFNGLGCISQQLAQWITGISIDLFMLRTGANMAFSLTFTWLAVLFGLLTFASYRLQKRNK